MKKRCPNCKEVLPLQSFNRHAGKKDGLQTNCRECQKKRYRKHYTDNPEYYRRANTRRKVEVKKKLLEYLASESCSDCGLTDVRVLEFDHVRGRKDPLSLV